MRGVGAMVVAALLAGCVSSEPLPSPISSSVISKNLPSLRGLRVPNDQFQQVSDLSFHDIADEVHLAHVRDPVGELLGLMSAGGAGKYWVSVPERSLLIGLNNDIEHVRSIVGNNPSVTQYNFLAVPSFVGDPLTTRLPEQAYLPSSADLLAVVSFMAYAAEVHPSARFRARVITPSSVPGARAGVTRLSSDLTRLAAFRERSPFENILLMERVSLGVEEVINSCSLSNPSRDIPGDPLIDVAYTLVPYARTLPGASVSPPALVQ